MSFERSSQAQMDFHNKSPMASRRRTRIALIGKNSAIEPRLPWQVRIEASAMVSEALGDDGDVATADLVESHVFHAACISGSAMPLPIRYADKLQDTISKILFAKRDATALEEDSFDPGAVPWMTRVEMSAGSPCERRFQEEERQRHQDHSKLEGLVEDFAQQAGEDADGRFVVRCGKCGASGDDVQEIDAQTRSADEGASVLGLCLKCGNRWKS